jgi:hypothetical protein
MGTERLTRPFLMDTIQRRINVPFNLLFRRNTSIDSLADLCEKSTVIPPTGFIFHMSRCGSTLVSQMLAALPSNIVVSEPPPVDLVITLVNKDPERAATTSTWLESMVRAYGRQRFADERRYFIKFDSWNTLDLDLIARKFPDVPWIFLYRNPVEVIVSQMKQRGSQMVPGAIERLLPGLSLADAVAMPPEEYCARVLARLCTAALSHAESSNGILVNYAELPDAVVGRIASHFQISFTEDEIAQMSRAAGFDAKTPQIAFEPDTERKRKEASETAVRAAAVWVDPLYERLEALRVNSTK